MQRIFSTTFLCRVQKSADAFDNRIKKHAAANHYISFLKRACHGGLVMVQDNCISLNQPFQHSRQKIASMKYCTYVSELSEPAAASLLFCMLRIWCCSDPLIEGEMDRKIRENKLSCMTPLYHWEIRHHVSPLFITPLQKSLVVYCDNIIICLCACMPFSKLNTCIWQRAYLPCKLAVSHQINGKIHDVV